MKNIIALLFAVFGLSFGQLASAQTNYCCKLNIMCRTPVQIEAVYHRSEFVEASDSDRCYAMANRTGGWGTGCYAVIDSRSGPDKVRANDPQTGQAECLSTSEMYLAGTCIWTLAVNCSDVDPSLTKQTDETKCTGPKPNGKTVKCCCPPSKAIFKGSSGATAPNLPNPLSCNSIPCVIGLIISKLLSILGAIALLVFIYGGFRWLTAAGNDKNIAAGKETLVWATIGIIFIFLAYILVGFVLQALGV